MSADLKELESPEGDTNGPEENVAIGEDNVAIDDPLPISSELIARRTGNSDHTQGKRRLEWRHLRLLHCSFSA